MIICSSYGVFLVNSGPKKDEWWTSDQGHGPEKWAHDPGSEGWLVVELL